MNSYGQTRIVLVTCANRKEARVIARNIVKRRLAACVNALSAPVESIYRWKGKIESASEVLLVIKTTAKRLSELEREVKRLHSYETPEFIVVPVITGSRDYLQWIAETVRPA
jgi:periplasmic divalent cation tolerance protein